MAVNIKEVFEKVGYCVSGGDEHGWQDLYPYGRFMDWEHNLTAIFSSKTQEVWELTFHDEENNLQWTWIAPSKRAEYQARHEKLAKFEDDFELQWCTDIGTVYREYIVRSKELNQPTYDEDDELDIFGAPV